MTTFYNFTLKTAPNWTKTIVKPNIIVHVQFIYS